MNYIQEILKCNLVEVIIIPETWCPSNFLTITFKGWRKVTLSVDDENLNNMIQIASISVKGIVSTYKDSHVFSLPKFCWTPNGEFEVKIGLMHNELYKKLKEREVSNLLHFVL